MTSKFRTNYTNKMTYNGRVMDNTQMVDTLGFIPHNIKVKNYINAGINLAKARAEQYDADANVKPEDIERNPFRDLGGDLVAEQHAKKRVLDAIEAKIKAQKEAEIKEIERVKNLEKNRVLELEKENASLKNKAQETPQKA